MSQHSRRTFLAGAGVAATAVAVPVSVTSAQASTAEAASASQAPTDPIVAYVRDARSGQIDVMIGDREVKVTNKNLARAIAGVVS